MPADTADLRRGVEEVMARHRIPGAAVAIVSRDSVLWVGAWGVADRDRGLEVDSTTVFRAGEISESVVAAALLVLAGEGRIALDAPVADLVPELEIGNAWAPAQPVRIVHLLEHTAGLGSPPLRVRAMRDPDLALGEALALTAEARNVRWAPGSLRLPSPVGPSVAAYALEAAAGEGFEAFVRRRLLVPLGMEAAGYAPMPAERARLAQGYRADGTTPVPPARPLLRPSAGLQLTSLELGTFTRFLLARGSLGGVELLREELVRWMERPATGPAARAGLDGGYGFGLETSVEEGFAFLGRTGSADGFTADFGYLPDAELGYAVMINASGPGFDELRGAVRSHLVRELARPATPPVVGLAPERLRRWSGYYEPITREEERMRFLDRLVAIVRIAPYEERGLRVRSLTRETTVLVQVGPGRFRVEGEPVATVAFLTDERGRLVLAGTSGVLRGSFAPVPAWSVWTRWSVASLVVLLIVSSLVSASVRAFGWRRGGIPPGERWTLTVLPAGASWSILLGFLLLWTTGEDAARRLGTPTFWSVGIFLLGLLFAAFTVAGFVEAVRARPGWASPRVRWHALLVAGANLLALIYLGAHGLVGFRGWAG